MSRIRQASLLLIVASIAYVAAFAWRQRMTPVPAVPDLGSLPPGSSDSLRLARLGIATGPHLVAYVFGGSRCGSCNGPEVKAALASLRDSLRRNNQPAFSSISVVGIAINNDVAEGMRYLTSLSPSAFDEVSAGRGWLNEHVTQRVWTDSTRVAAAPQVIVVARHVSAALDPMALSFSPDSVVKVVFGAAEITEWVQSGAHVQVAAGLAAARAEQR